MGDPTNGSSGTGRGVAVLRDYKREGVQVMKLVEILARELEEWPEGAAIAVQDSDLQVKFTETDDAVRKLTGVWIRGGRADFDLVDAPELATDHATAIVTREMWEAEQDAVTVRERQGRPTVPVSLEPDWSKAPECYPLWLEYLPKVTNWIFSYKKLGGEWAVDAGDRYETESGAFWAKAAIDYYRVYERPTQPQWTGEGLPPVGVTVEIGSTTGIVVAHDAGRAVIRVFPGFDDYVAVTADELRPVRTPRDKWIEAALALDCDPCEGMLSRKDFCGKVYDTMIAKLPEDGE